MRRSVFARLWRRPLRLLVGRSPWKIPSSGGGTKNVVPTTSHHHAHGYPVRQSNRAEESDADTQTVTATNCTIVSENHDTHSHRGLLDSPSNPDPIRQAPALHAKQIGPESCRATWRPCKELHIVAQERSRSTRPTRPRYGRHFSDLYLETRRLRVAGAGNISSPALLWLQEMATIAYLCLAARDSGDPTFPPIATGLAPTWCAAIHRHCAGGDDH